ncbi:hypothetical protein Bpfe_008657 [Biomphalaria pfeifferi]|uniref:Cilia- and flagella-associated protein 418 n=1 Tax=Biomphalaria pfeifferi TaxID=112525 RepID=A0AAD8FE92_BIOPF|nr:hypothetical protein Bpfe_008657 [Biomphalaria pfeifferi]
MDKVDIDELLDEVETKFVKPSRPPSTRSSSVPNKKLEKKTVENDDNKKNSKCSLDSLINDILDIDLDKSEETTLGSSCSRNNSRLSATEDGKKSERFRRCLPVFLGGSSDGTGIGTSINKRPCDQLRCTSCDFKVCYFENRCWHKDTDYLFLRNNVPDLKKLEPRLSRKTGCRAYCCQCSWRNVQELSELSDPSLKWVCGKHAL